LSEKGKKVPRIGRLMQENGKEWSSLPFQAEEAVNRGDKFSQDCS
jgi:hypothetical protein